MATRFTLTATLVAAAIPVAAGASSFDYRGRDVRTELVNIADLDLSTGWGMDKAIKRLRSRIDDMCDNDAACRDEAWLSADWQVARRLSHDQWRARIAEERMADRRAYRVRTQRSSALGGSSPRIAFVPSEAAPPPGAVRVGETVTTTTRNYTVKTTTVRVIYRLPPPDAPGWAPRCGCDGAGYR